MNQPARFELVVLPDGVKKVTVQKDLKIPNAAKFIIQREDHTLGNILRERVVNQKGVTFAAYKVPHPLEPLVELIVHTDKTSSPIQAVSNAVDDLNADIGILVDRFNLEVSRIQQEASNAGNYGFSK